MRPIRGSPRSIRSSGAAAEESGRGSGRKEGRRSTRPSWSIWLFDTDEFDAGRPKPKTALWCDKSSFKTRGQHPFPFKQFCTPFSVKNTPLHNTDQARVPKRSSSREAIGGRLSCSKQNIETPTPPSALSYAKEKIRPSSP